VQQVRIAQNQSNVVRVVIDLKQEVNFNVFALTPVGEYQHRLVLDVLPLKDPIMAMLDKLDKQDSELESKLKAIENKPLVNAPTKRKPTSKKVQKKRIITIAIDAGHGGEDPGALGAKGSHEKNITLAIAKKLKAKVDAEPNMRGVLTRKGDYFVSLSKRVVKARKLKADLFISIHADSFTKSSAQGSSVFALSERGATSATARYLAKKENQSDLIGGVSLKGKEPILARTLLDLSQAATINDSLKLGKAVLGYIGNINVLHKKHVEQAAFAVLKSPDTPSILIETAFISNPAEERKLNNSRHQGRLASSILAGIKKYFKANPPLARTVASY
jgi:N-acetylmuramoyl-L-alanine amidase